MPNSAMSWEKRIVEAMRLEKSAAPGRAGETPVSTLAMLLSRLGTAQERSAVVDALQDLIENPPSTLVSDDEKEFWRVISYLAKHLPHTEKEELQSVFRAKLFDQNVRKRGLSIFALHGFIAVRGRLLPADLEMLSDIKKNAPIAWLGAAVMSSLFPFAREQAIRLLRKGDIDVSMFVMGMDAWRDIWKEREDFGEVILQFRDASPTQEAKATFTRWLERRGYLSQAKKGVDILRPVNAIDGFILKARQVASGWRMPTARA